MTIVDLLEKNATEYPNMECLVELNPQIVAEEYKTWREYQLVEPTLASEYRRSIFSRRQGQEPLKMSL